MRKLKAVKASFLLAIFLFGMCVAFTTAPASAQGILQGNVVLTYDSSQVGETIRPETDTRVIEVSVNHYVSGLGSKLLIPFYQDRSTVPIELSITSQLPDWMDAGISPGVVYQQLSSVSGEHPSQIAYLTISLSPNAPAFLSRTIEITATSQYTPPVRSAVNKISIPVKSGYYSNFNYEVPPFKEIGAGETVEFAIEVTGFANALAKLTFEVLDQPEGWSTAIDPELTLGSSALDQKANATHIFTVQSPLTFGYHNEVEKFRVRVSTFAAGHPELGADNSTILQFTVRARGFSTPGFELPFIMLALMAVIIIYRKRSKK